jgi:hypothetical protein
MYVYIYISVHTYMHTYIQTVVVETKRRVEDSNIVTVVIALNLGMMFYGFMAEVSMHACVTVLVYIRVCTLC